MSIDDDEAGDELERVARIHPVVERLRALLASATLLELRASSQGYWADRVHDGDEFRGAGTA